VGVCKPLIIVYRRGCFFLIIIHHSCALCAPNACLLYLVWAVAGHRLCT
jgi:hypothetical protein